MLLYWLWLSGLNGIGSVLAKRLITIFNDPESIYKADLLDLKSVDGIGTNIANSIFNNKSTEKAEKILESCCKSNIKILTINDKLYDNRFKFKESPIIFYYKGNIKQNEKSTAVIGTRNCTEYGKEATRDITKKLIEEGSTIVSGLSKGIEGVANTVALKNNGRTMAFLPCGIDYIYPKEHKNLIEAIPENGALISQYPPGYKINHIYFLEKNKRIAEWADNIILIEATERSGTLATVEYANKISKIVYAIPHNIQAKEGQYNNSLIYNRKAELFLPKLKSLKQNELVNEATASNEIQLKILSKIENRDKKIYIEELKEILKINEDELLNELFMLEVSGKIEVNSGIVSAKNFWHTGQKLEF